MKILEKWMIKWKLREVMARGRITNRELAQYINHHETSVSRMKMSDTMPRIDGETLNTLCNGLTKLFQVKGQNVTITPSDLIDYTFDNDNGGSITLLEESNHSPKQTGLNSPNTRKSSTELKLHLIRTRKSAKRPA